MPAEPLYIGTNGHVCAINPESGNEIWRTKLQQGIMKATTAQDVAIIVKNGIIFAGSQGHLFALSADSGRILWQNDMKGLGYNDISLAFEGHSIQYLQKVIHSSNTNHSP